MLRFIIRRLMQLVLVIFVLSLLLFLWLRALPGENLLSLHLWALPKGALNEMALVRRLLAGPAGTGSTAASSISTPRD